MLQPMDQSTSEHRCTAGDGKVCSRCGSEKSRSEFHKDSSRADGLSYVCKNCGNEKGRLWYRSNWEKRAMSLRTWNLNNRDKRRVSSRKSVKKWNSNNPEQSKSRRLLRSAIERCDLKREPCEVCGEPKSHGHHDDYSKPLEVRWLCVKHHAEHHRLERRAGAVHLGTSVYLRRN
jgi:hypothetical protein